ncbi:MAG: valine--tRNA ligase [Microthrixaceae bacterium]|nr:valine--tRNA ligase [Microthrixaceae bacterium]
MASNTEPTPKALRSVPDKPSPDGLEDKWAAAWDREGTYHFDRSAVREGVFSIDTPPPTVSGSLHVGHVFSYSHTDTIARYQRMRGRAVFYPMGWDDNGVPTERRVENHFGILCDPSLPYVEGYEAPESPAKERREYQRISRRNFIEMCARLTAIDEEAFKDLFRHLGLSVDWRQEYTTISRSSQRTSQAAFLRNLARGEAYSADAPCLWDTTFQMAVSQAELEDKERPGAYHDLAFRRPDGSDLRISTTRPELLVSCVAVVAHPDDARYQPLFGTTVTTPLFGVEVPVHAHRLADPDKGSGIAMICTFGDTTDVTWWRELDLPARAVIGRDGRFQQEVPSWLGTDLAQDRYSRLGGLYVKQAQRACVEMLRESGELLGEPEPITHAVKFYEKGDQPLEIVQSRQWYIRNGGRDDALAESLVTRGTELAWHPAYMRHRYDNWIEGLAGDWLVSRQRYFGVPIPVWYPLDSGGAIDYDRPILPDEADLPVDPQSEPPSGYDESQRGLPGGFVGDPDIFDTWATSSLTPQIAGGWIDDTDLFERVFPMDMRPQGHDIIRTWLFSTMVRSNFEHGVAPWRNAALSGWILDPDRKKMSKSKGNVVTPMGLLEQYGSDGVRYWAASGRPGTDTAFDEKEMKVGRRLSIKLLNASKFALSFGEAATSAISEPLDRALLAALAELVAECTSAFDDFDYARSLERSEAFFWSFCDDYLELVKQRAYGSGDDAGAESAKATLSIALSVLQRLFAPILPFVAEEVWSWWMEGSIHLSEWPDAEGLRRHAAGGDRDVLTVASDVLREVRRAKSEAKVSMRAEVASVKVTAPVDRLDAARAAEADLRDAGSISELAFAEGDWDVVVALAEG